MKKIYLLGFFLLIFLLSSNTSFAKDSYTAGIASDSAQKVNYELPYPGLLPDSPLYFLRVIRDKVISLLISDPLKKSEFDLLQADKRLNAGIALFNKGKDALALSTISKALNYFKESVDKINEAQKQGMDVKDMGRKLINALVKHEEELGKLINKTDKDLKANFEKEQKRLMEFGERLSK